MLLPSYFRLMPRFGSSLCFVVVCTCLQHQIMSPLAAETMIYLSFNKCLLNELMENKVRPAPGSCKLLLGMNALKSSGKKETLGFDPTSLCLFIYPWSSQLGLCCYLLPGLTLIMGWKGVSATTVWATAQISRVLRCRIQGCM